MIQGAMGVSVNQTELSSSPSGGDIHQIWKSVSDAVEKKPAMAWVRHLSLVDVNQDTARVATRPGCHELSGFLTSQRRQQLADLLEPIIARPVRVELEIPTDNKTVSDRDVEAVDHQEVWKPVASKVVADPRFVRISQTDRTRAMSLPIVKQIMDLFDVTLVGVHPITIETGTDINNSNTSD